MKMLSEKRALAKLQKLKTDYRELIKNGYEHKAKSCETCETKGACCLDAHFVNVHITRLEAVAIRESLEKFDEEKQREIYERVEKTIEKYDLKSEGDTFSQTFACPLFEKNIGCLVHQDAKPAPCIQHACYERKEDLPPDELLEKTENLTERLNRQAYGQNPRWLPLPVRLKLLKL
jgi:hypothetical protein